MKLWNYEIRFKVFGWRCLRYSGWSKGELFSDSFIHSFFVILLFILSFIHSRLNIFSMVSTRANNIYLAKGSYYFLILLDEKAFKLVYFFDEGLMILKCNLFISFLDNNLKSFIFLFIFTKPIKKLIICNFSFEIIIILSSENKKTF